MRYFLFYYTLLISVLVLVLSCSPSKEKIFAKEAEEQNRRYPMMVDPYTRIDSIGYTAAENIFRYYYTLTGNADNADIAARKREELRKQLPATIKAEPGLAIHRKHGVIMEYIYFSERSGNELLRIRITPDMY